MADRKISQLPPLTGSLDTADALAIVDDSASETKKISPAALLENSLTLIPDSSIPSSKISGIAIADGSVTTSKLADGSVTAVKLANNSSGVVATGVLSAGVVVGQVGLSTTDNKLYIWDGTSWRGIAAPASVNEITADNTGTILEVTVTDNGDGTVTISSAPKDTTGARQFLAGPTQAAGVVSARQIIGADLPVSTSTTLGAIVVNGGGLAVSADGIISIDNNVTAQSSRSLVTYDANGLVLSGSPIQPVDLPVATASTVGAVRPGPALVVDGAGDLTIEEQTAAGTFTKVTVNNQGLVQSGTTLTNNDLPAIDANKIETGFIRPTVIEDRSIQEIKLADYSTCYVQEGQPSDNPKLGQFWFTPSTSQLRVYGRGSNQDLWLSVGFGALQAQNLRWGGTVNAADSTITTLTDIGVSEGLTAGGPIPTPTDELSGLYFVVATAGNAITIPNVNGDMCTEGDWILYIDQAQGAVHLDIAAGGGGGGGASKLNDLTDVDITNVEGQQFLQYDAISGMWVNVSLIDGGTY